MKPKTHKTQLAMCRLGSGLLKAGRSVILSATAAATALAANAVKPTAAQAEPLFIFRDTPQRTYVNKIDNITFQQFYDIFLRQGRPAKNQIRSAFVPWETTVLLSNTDIEKGLYSPARYAREIERVQPGYLIRHQPGQAGTRLFWDANLDLGYERAGFTRITLQLTSTIIRASGSMRYAILPTKTTKSLFTLAPLCLTAPHV